jgi:hypothetical protein
MSYSLAVIISCGLIIEKSVELPEEKYNVKYWFLDLTNCMTCKTARLDDQTLPGSCQGFDEFYDNSFKIKQRSVVVNTILFDKVLGRKQ